MSFTVLASEVIKYDRTDHELELFWLFCGVVAGKTAEVQARLLDKFLHSLSAPLGRPDSPFARIRHNHELGDLGVRLRESRLGQYAKLERFMVESLGLNLRTATIEDLEHVHGCGPKTARYFLLDTRPDVRHAALDTHVLKHLRAHGVDAPRSTPPAGPRYRELEEAFLRLADASDMTVAEYDLWVWKQYAGYA